MACSGCASKRKASVKPVIDNRQSTVQGVVVEASADTSNKVKLRYFGGGSKKTTGGCSTCHGSKGGYVVTTSETIRFVSEDAPGGLFVETFSIGHDYYVTEKQAEYLLTLTYRNRAGQIVHKFKKES